MLLSRAHRGHCANAVLARAAALVCVPRQSLRGSGVATRCANRAPSAAVPDPSSAANPLPRSGLNFLQQERITTDGRLATAGAAYQTLQRQQQQQHHQHHNQQQQEQQEQQTPPVHSEPQRPPGLAAAAPLAPPVAAAELDALAELVRSSDRVLVITGAGCSTESNVPDYRGPSGAYTTGFTPMTHQQFLAKHQNRARYWARSFAGWHEFASVPPNAAHEAIASLQSRGWLGPIITQNVDRLHQRGGSRDVLELHGTTHRVRCLDCGAESCRHELQNRLAILNPAAADAARTAAAAAAAAGFSGREAYRRALAAGTAADARKVAAAKGAEQVPVRRPDGDVELADAGTAFVLAPCSECGGQMLKPDVVFFGDSVPKDRTDRAMAEARAATTVLVVGSSLMVWSAFRLIKAAKESGATLAIVNVGETRADGLADLKIQALAGEALARLAAHPSLAVPRV